MPSSRTPPRSYPSLSDPGRRSSIRATGIKSITVASPLQTFRGASESDTRPGRAKVLRQNPATRMPFQPSSSTVHRTEETCGCGPRLMLQRENAAAFADITVLAGVRYGVPHK